MSEDSVSINASTAAAVNLNTPATRDAPAPKLDRSVAGSKPTPASNPTPVEVPKVDPVKELARIEQIEDLGLEIATETFSIDRIREKVRELEAALPKASNSLIFRVDEVLDRPVITVVDKKSGEVVRTLPSDETLRVVHNIEKMKGIIFEDRS